MRSLSSLVNGRMRALCRKWDFQSFYFLFYSTSSIGPFYHWRRRCWNEYSNFGWFSSKNSSTRWHWCICHGCSKVHEFLSVAQTFLSFRSLGPLNYIRIWHDNTGRGESASWFLKYIIVRDLQTMEKSHFICQRWLAVEKDDGAVSIIINLFYQGSGSFE